MSFLVPFINFIFPMIENIISKKRVGEAQRKTGVEKGLVFHPIPVIL